MNRSKLERMELIAVDTKKEFLYDKSTGKWGWRNRDEDLPDFEFPTRFDALQDAVGPYLEDDEEDGSIHIKLSRLIGINPPEGELMCVEQEPGNHIVFDPHQTIEIEVDPAGSSRCFSIRSVEMIVDFFPERPKA